MLYSVTILAYALLLAFLAFFFWSFLKGAPYVRAKKRLRGQIWGFAELKKGDLVLDLGSGDGVLLRSLAKEGARGLGWEINPLLVAWSRLANAILGIKDVRIERKNFWVHGFPPADVVVVYGIERIMKKLGDKAKRELRPGTKMVSVGFSIPNLEEKKLQKGLFLYIL